MFSFWPLGALLVEILAVGDMAGSRLVTITVKECPHPEITKTLRKKFFLDFLLIIFKKEKFM